MEFCEACISLIGQPVLLDGFAGELPAVRELPGERIVSERFGVRQTDATGTRTVKQLRNHGLLADAYHCEKTPLRCSLKLEVCPQAELLNQALDSD